MRGTKSRRVVAALTIAVAAMGGTAYAASGGHEIRLAAAASPVSVGHSGWLWGSPTPQGQTLDRVAFDGSTGYASGANGTVLRSTDDGATWTGLAANAANADLTELQQLDPSTVIVAGDCAVRESTDGGRRFRALPLSASGPSCSSPVSGLAFSSASTGYVLESDGAVSYTTDGGRTLAARTPVPTGDAPSANALRFISPTVGFAVTGLNGAAGGKIERTTDGGNSWTQVAATGHALKDITFVDGQTGYAVGEDGTLLATTDGGADWASRPLAGIARDRSSLGHIACSGPADCLISVDASRSVLRTTDGGLTASVVTPAANNINDVAFATGTDVVGVGDVGTTVLSTDGGARFPTLISNPTPAESSSSARSVLRAGGRPGQAYLLGGGGNLLVTGDGGGRWTRLRVPGGADLVDAAFPTETAGFTIGTDDVLRSTANGGQTWRSQDAGVGGRTSLAATGRRNVLLIGPVGVRRSSDGGADFHPVAGRVRQGSGAGPRVRSLRADHALTVGRTVYAWSAATAYASTDGGRTWRAIPLPRRTRITDLSFVSPSTGDVLDRSGDVLGTRNGGRTWTKVTSLGTNDIGHISFASARSGFVTVFDHGGNGRQLVCDVLATTDGGRTWEPQTIDASGSHPVNSAILATPGHAYYADDQGVDGGQWLFSTAHGGRSGTPSRLTITIGAQRVTARALRSSRHGRVPVRGRLSSLNVEGERVELDYRTPNAHGWHSRLIRVASDGRFQTTLTKIRSTTDIVVLAIGNGIHRGAGAHVRLTVTR